MAMMQGGPTPPPPGAASPPPAQDPSGGEGDSGSGGGGSGGVTALIAQVGAGLGDLSQILGKAQGLPPALKQKITAIEAAFKSLVSDLGKGPGEGDGEATPSPDGQPVSMEAGASPNVQPANY